MKLLLDYHLQEWKEGQLDSTTVTVELNVGIEEDVDKDTNDRMLEVVTGELNVKSDVKR